MSDFDFEERPAEEFDWKAVAPGDEHFALALEEYHAGKSFPEIVSLLRAKGLAEDLVPDLITALAKNRVFYLLSAGKSSREVEQVLVERGLLPEEAGPVVRAVTREREHTLASVGGGRGQALSLLVGGLLTSAGVACYVLKRFGIVDVPGEVIIPLVGLGSLVAAFGGVVLYFRSF